MPESPYSGRGMVPVSEEGASVVDGRVALWAANGCVSPMVKGSRWMCVLVVIFNLFNSSSVFRYDYLIPVFRKRLHECPIEY